MAAKVLAYCPQRRRFSPTCSRCAAGTRTQAYFRELFVLRHTPDGRRIHKYMFSQNPAQA
jgi:hypothetical protein